MVYKTHYILGKLDKLRNKKSNIANIASDYDAFNGYIDGYCDNLYFPSTLEQPILLLEKLQENKILNEEHIRHYKQIKIKGDTVD